MGILEARKAAGKTQKQTADYLGITDSAVNQWEKGKTKPKLGHLLKLTEFFECTLDDLLRGE